MKKSILILTIGLAFMSCGNVAVAAQEIGQHEQTVPKIETGLYFTDHSSIILTPFVATATEDNYQVNINASNGEMYTNKFDVAKVDGVKDKPFSDGYPVVRYSCSFVIDTSYKRNSSTVTINSYPIVERHIEVWKYSKIRQC